MRNVPITPIQAKAMADLAAAGWLIAEIGRAFDVAPQSVRKIINRDRVER